MAFGTSVGWGIERERIRLRFFVHPDLPQFGQLYFSLKRIFSFFAPRSISALIVPLLILKRGCDGGRGQPVANAFIQHDAVNERSPTIVCAR